MAEADDGLFLIDGEDAGATPWEFDSLTETGTSVIALDAAAKNNGDNGYRATVDGADGTCYAEYVFGDQADVYIRFYIYIPSGQDLNAAFRNHILFDVLDAGSDTVGFGIRAAGTAAPTLWFWDIRGIGTGNSATNFSTDAWHRVEIRVVKDAVNGGAEIWIDGDSILSDLDQDTSDRTSDRIRAGAQQDTSGYFDTDGDYIDFDDIKADTSPVGAYSEAGGSIVPIVMQQMDQFGGGAML